MLNDYKGLKLIASSNPHIRNNEDTRSIMLDAVSYTHLTLPTKLEV